MNLIFGSDCDGLAFPDFPGDGRGALDSAVVGPLGLINALEVELGLTRPTPSPAVRIAAFARKLHAALDPGAVRFYAASFEQDPWACAKLLLSWRDELVSSGWRGEPLNSPRLTDLAAVEKAGPELPLGSEDRFQLVLDRLGAGAVLRLGGISLVEDRALLPPHIDKFLQVLEHLGVTVAPLASAVGARGADLLAAQAFLRGESASPLSGDGSLTILEADTALMAADAVADWLAAGGEEALLGSVVICPSGDTAMLDAALQARGLPALGLSAASSWRGALQVLPLAFKAAWKPFDAKALLDLLLLPKPPMERWAARKLAGVLARHPGIGGVRWVKAWSEIEEKVRSEADPDTSPAKLESKLKGWRQWTEGGRFDRFSGMSAQDAKAIAHRVADWARSIDSGGRNPLYLSVSSAASALCEAIDGLGFETLNALLLDRMVEQVLADGAQNPDHIATAGGLRAVRCPAAIWNPAPRIVWWDFTGPGDRASPPVWTRSERAQLEEAGCLLEPQAKKAAWISWSYAHAVQMAQENLILVSPALSGGDETTSHPLAHQLYPLVKPAGAKVRWSAEALLKSDHTVLAGRTLHRAEVPVLETPKPVSHWPLSASALVKMEGRKESATSFNQMVDCQLRWMLLDVLKLTRSRMAEIPSPAQLFGNLAHEIASQVLKPGAIPDEAAVRANVEAIFEELLGAIAAPLQQPEHTSELAFARERIPSALVRLAGALKDKDLEVVGTELYREASFSNGLAVHGLIDLLVTHAVHGVGVIDLKWSRGDKYRREEVAEGRALQLATYGAIADPDGLTFAPGAYYLLSQRTLFGPKGSFVAEEEITPARTLEATWDDLVSTWRSWRHVAEKGSVFALGLEPDPDDLPQDLRITPKDKPCTYCELKTLCRVEAQAI